MIIYNETFVIEEASAGAWLAWMKATYIPEVLATGLFKSHKILSVLDSPNEGITCCIQYLTDDLEKYEIFHANVTPGLHNRLHQQFANKFVVFNTVMEEMPN